MTKTLLEINSGKEVSIKKINSNIEICNRLREIGFCENAKIKCISNNGSMLICEVCNSKFGINDNLAKEIFVVSSN